MPTNPYIKSNSYNQMYSIEDNLVKEAIRFGGFDVIYMPREYISVDDILDEIKIAEYNESFTIEAYIEVNGEYTPNSFEFAPFGFPFVGQGITLAVSKTRFEDEAPEGQKFPEEGDVIYIPMIDKFFELTNVDTRDPFLSGGKILFHRLVFDPYEHNQDVFEEALKNVPDFTDNQGVNHFEKFQENLEDDPADQTEELDDGGNEHVKDTGF